MDSRRRENEIIGNGKCTVIFSPSDSYKIFHSNERLFVAGDWVVVNKGAKE
jgi:hypothetical protein